MRRFYPFWEFPAVAHDPVKNASFRQTALASGFAPVAKGDAQHPDLFALGENLGFGPRPRCQLVSTVTWLTHVQENI
jgi:hypothetical protein